MMKNIFLLFLCFSFCISVSSQNVSNELQRPKLVVGIVVDQMRWDYLYRYYDLYSADGGFKRLINKGFSCENTLIPYTPTVTAAGHTSIYTGSVPAINGIVGNDWYDRVKDKYVYCASDDSAATVGANDDKGKMSPRNLMVTTITDELRLATNFKSKVIGISMKDRAAIFPAGHAANAAYWYDSKTGDFISSTYYMNELPQWINNFNSRKIPDSLFRLNWDLSQPVSVYQQYCGADDESWEGKPFGKNQKQFPYSLNQYAQKDYSRMTYTPHANTLLESLAEAAVINENLGHNSVTDFLTVSFSAPDYIGHTFGPESWEQLDDYLRLDKTLGKFFEFLDKEIGAGNYLIFLSADHGAANSPGYAVKHNLPGGAFDESDLSKGLKQLLQDKYKTKNLVEAHEEYQVTLNDALIDSLKLDKDEIEKTIIDYAEKTPGIARAVSMQHISTTTLTAIQKKMFTNSYFPQRSGDIMFVLQPGYVAGHGTGTSHGLWNPYDAHIPLLWYGWNIKQGKTNRETYMTDIAATLAALLHIQMPSGCVGTVIEEVMK